MTQLTGLHAKFTGDASGFKGAATQAIGLVDQFGRSLQKVETAEQKASAASKKLAQDFHKLRMETDNSYAANVRYVKAAELATKVAKAQEWSTEQLNAELARLATHYKVAEVAGLSMNEQVRNARFHTANLAAQFNDIGVMLAAGQSPLMLAVQQGTQITQVLQNMGGTARMQFGALRAAALSIISPTSLLTIGLIAGGAALFQWGLNALSAEEATDTLKTAIEEMREETANLNEELRAAAGGFESVTRLRVEDAIVEARLKVAKAAAEVAAADVESYSFKQRELAIAEEALAVLLRDVEENENKKRIQQQNEIIQKGMMAREMAHYTAIGQAEEQRQAEATAFHNKMLITQAAHAARIKADNAKQEANLITQYQLYAETRVEADQIKESMGSAYLSGLNFSQLDISAGVGAAAQAASLLAERMNISLADAKEMIRLAAEESIKRGNLAAQYALYGQGRAAAEGLIRENNPNYGGTGNVLDGRGYYDTENGGRASVNPLQRELEQLQESFKSAEQIQLDSYARQQEILQQALDQRLITQKSYAQMMEQVEQSHQFAMLRQTNDGVQNTLSALGNLFQGSKKIGAAVALANSWISFTEVLKDPSFIGRPWARFAAAASALSAGLNAVRNIKATNPGSGAAAVGGAGAGGAVASSASSASQVSQQVAIQLTGGDMFSRDQVVRLINAINEATGDGARIVMR